MQTWRCPHCSTPQPAASRCWVCHRSSTSCGTCRHFRGSVAARLGFCGLDRRHEPLHGDEVRACWEDRAVALPPDPATPGLLDLLTVAGIGGAGDGAVDGPPDRVDARPDRRGGDRSDRSDAGPGRDPARASGSRRLWVEVEA